jgi:hypothetical protein
MPPVSHKALTTLGSFRKTMKEQLARPGRRSGPPGRGQGPVQPSLRRFRNSLSR